MPKAYAIYNGVKIFTSREVIPGSDFKLMKDGSIKDKKPSFYPTAFNYSGSYKYNTMKECKEAIDSVESGCKAKGCYDRETFESTMNG